MYNGMKWYDNFLFTEQDDNSAELESGRGNDPDYWSSQISAPRPQVLSYEYLKIQTGMDNTFPELLP